MKKNQMQLSLLSVKNLYWKSCLHPTALLPSDFWHTGCISWHTPI